MISTGNSLVLYLIAFLMPPVGFILGGIYLVNDDEDVRKIGENLIAIPFIGVLLMLILAVWVFIAISSG
jgi:hypothetical protein